MKKLIFFSFIILITFGCVKKTSDTVIESNDSVSIKQDIEDPGIIIQLQFGDTLHNPFIADAEYSELKEAGKNLTIEKRFKATIKQFKHNDLPLAFGPKPDPYMKTKAIITDSLFIVDCLEDKYMYQGYPDVMSCYVKGRIVDTTPNYLLVVFLYRYDVGFDYELYSFTNDGKMISMMNIGGEGPDWYEDYGVIDDKKNFRVQHKEFDRESRRKMTLKSTKTTKYTITDKGEFVIVK